MTPKEYFDVKVPENLKTKGDKVTSINAVYEFQISGPNGGTWTLDLTAPGGAVCAGSSGGKATCTVLMDDENFVKMVSGELNAQMAFMTGKLKVTGNMGLALKLATIL